MKKAKTRIGITLVAILLILATTVDVASARFSTVITRWWSGTFSKVNTETLGYTANEAKTNGKKITKETEGEGAVLLKNSGLLPLKSQNISLIGYGSYDPMYIGCGSVGQDPKGTTAFTDFYKAFENDGFTCNQDMLKYYKGAKSARNNKAGGMFNMNGADFNIYDQPLSSYQNVMDAASKSADTAVVVISRTGGEGADEPLDMKKYKNGDAGKSYLELQQTEINMLKYCEDKYKHVIVVINSSNAMQLGFLNDKKIDAAIWIGGPGATGMQAVADIINGKTNPSGKLADTYAYDLKSAPSYYTCTAGTYKNYKAFDMSSKGYDTKVDGGVNYYTEGIYEGYRYYETAAAEGFIDYNSTVQYPFGYGLSYTSFDWKVDDYHIGDVHGQITVDVDVKNTGTVAGKDVVELYYTAPYYKGGIEKSEKELGAFAKTKELKAGETQKLTLTMNVDDLASYDYSGKGCYVADKGTYKFNLQTDSHNVKKGCKTIKYNLDSKRVYNDKGVGKRSTDQVVAENHFDKVSAGDGNINSSIPYVTRSDFAHTVPQVTMKKHITEMSLNMGDSAVKNILKSEGGSDVNYANDDKYKTSSMIKVATDQKNGLTVKDLAHNTNWNDKAWDKLVNQMSVKEMVQLVSDCAYGTPKIKSIGKKLATDVDGPAGVSSQNLNYYGNEYTAEVVMASTWNTDLVNRIGKSVARECKAAGISGWYAPACDTHRTPFGGRCGEYFSEDPVLSGNMVAAETKGAQNQGIYVYVKHFALNDQDSKRGGMYTWANEQAIREIYLKPFEYAVKDGKATALMEGYNRIGTMECSTSYALNTSVLRNEWGFKGYCITDGYNPMFGSQKYNSPDLQLRAGAGALLYTGGYQPKGCVTAKTTKSDAGIQMLHDTCKRMIYAYCNSSAMKVSRDYTPYWIIPVVALNVVLVGLAGLAGIFMIYKPIKKRKCNNE